MCIRDRNGPGLRGAKSGRSIWLDGLPGAIFSRQKAVFTATFLLTAVGMHAVQLPVVVGVESLFHNNVMSNHPAVLLPGL